MNRTLILLIAGALIAGAISIGVVVASSGGGDGGPSGVSAAAPATTATASTATPLATQPPVPTVAPPTLVDTTPPAPQPAAAPQLRDRTSCSEIRGTDYRSAAEEAFFRANCINAAPAPTQRPASAANAPAPPPPPAAPAGGASQQEAEATYRNKAAAQLTYFGAQLEQWLGSKNGLSGNAAILQAYSITGNFISALDSLQPVPPRFQGVHNELRASLAAFRVEINAAMSITTLAQLQAWSQRTEPIANRADRAIENFNAVVGTNIPRIR